MGQGGVLAPEGMGKVELLNAVFASAFTAVVCTRAPLTQEAGGSLEVGGLGWGSRRQMWHPQLCGPRCGVVGIKARAAPGPIPGYFYTRILNCGLKR